MSEVGSLHDPSQEYRLFEDPGKGRVRQQCGDRSGGSEGRKDSNRVHYPRVRVGVPTDDVDEIKNGNHSVSLDTDVPVLVEPVEGQRYADGEDNCHEGKSPNRDIDHEGSRRETSQRKDQDE